MAARSPTNLNTSRNIALQKGVAPANLSQPDLSGFAPMGGNDPAEAAKPSGFGSPPVQKAPFAVKGG